MGRVPWSYRLPRFSGVLGELELAVLCLRFGALVSDRVFRPYPKRKVSYRDQRLQKTDSSGRITHVRRPRSTCTPMHDKMGELEIMMVLDWLLTRLEYLNAARKR